MQKHTQQDTPLNPPIGPFAVSEITTSPWTFEQDVEQYARLGVDIELVESKVNSKRLEEQMALIQQHKLRITSLQPEVLTIFPNATRPEPADPHQRLKQMRRTIDRFSPYCPDVPLITNTGALSNGNEAEVWKTIVPLYRFLADYAAEYQMRIALEPLSPSQMNRSTVIWNLAQAMQMLEAINRPNVGICVDLYNIWQDDAWPEHIQACKDHIFITQISDWRLPRSFHDRSIPGQGEIPLASMLHSIYKTGYRGPYVLEIFSADVPSSLWQTDLTNVIQTSKSAFETAWRASLNTNNPTKQV